MLGQYHTRGADHLGAEDDRMHHKILGGIKGSYIVPGAYAVLGEYVCVFHYMAGALGMLVNVVAEEQVYLFAFFYKAAYAIHNTLERYGVKPVVRVDYLKIKTLGVAYALIYALTVSTVFLVDGADYIGISGCILVCYLGGIVLCGAVVYYEYLSLVTCGQQRFYAVTHILG